MAVIKFFLFIAYVVAIDLVTADGNPKVIILEHTVTVAPDNPYYGQWSSEIIPPGESINIKCPVINDIPDDLRTRSTVMVDGEVIFNEDALICETMENPDVKEMNEHGIPKDKFPKQCPIKACEECEIVNYKFSLDKIPPGMPATKFVVKSIVYKDDENAPYLTVDATYKLIYE